MNGFCPLLLNIKLHRGDMGQLGALLVPGHAANQSAPPTQLKVNAPHACGYAFQGPAAALGSSVRASVGSPEKRERHYFEWRTGTSGSLLTSAVIHRT